MSDDQPRHQTLPDAAVAARTPGSPPGTGSVAPYDEVLLLSFGGPEAPEEVLPFLENVTRGKNIPKERLVEVGEHYYARGGRSPINDLNRQLLAALRTELGARAGGVPLRWGNRNWDPYLVDALREAHDAGARRVLVLATSAYASYSGCRQYREDVAGALTTLAGEGRTLQVDKARHYFNLPGFVTASVDAVVEAIGTLPAAADGDPAGQQATPRLVFVTHSIPTAMAESAGPDGNAYVQQHLDVAEQVAERVAQRTGRAHEWGLTYCSRSGPPSQPWLEPDVNDHLGQLAQSGTRSVVLVPIGFVSDHMEVVHDLDTEAVGTARDLGLHVARAATAGTHPEFVKGLVDLVLERAAAERGDPVTRPAVGPLGPSHDVCPAGCCPNLRDPARPAACGADRVVCAATPGKAGAPTGRPVTS